MIFAQARSVFRAAIIVTLTIPMSIALAGILLNRLNVGLNTMTLGGLAIAVGLLVDAAIIVTENIIHRLTGTAPEHHKEIAVRAATEVGRPIAFATVIVIAVFLSSAGGVQRISGFFKSHFGRRTVRAAS